MTSSDSDIGFPSPDDTHSPPSGASGDDLTLEKLATAARKLGVAGAPPVGLSDSSTLEALPTPATSSIAARGNCGCYEGKEASYVFAIGTIGYDFGTEARKDSFRQLMPVVQDRPPNPYAAEQMVSYLRDRPSEASKLIWTFNLELTPIYAVEAELPYAREIHEFLRNGLEGQIQRDDSHDYISRVSLPGILTNRTVRLYSGQIVPIVIAQHRSLWSWNIHSLVNAVIARFDEKQHAAIRVSLENFLNRVYYELRNLGRTSPDRALNFAATNAFQASEAISNVLHPRGLIAAPGLYTLADISVSKSPFCRMDSDCWDVKLTFFDPENERRARTVLRFTIDVSDELPVTLGPIRHWAEAAR